METQALKPFRTTSPMLWIAGVAITIFCATGVAAMMGWLPSTSGHANEGAIPVAPVKGATATVRPHASAPAPRAAQAPAVDKAIAVVKCATCGVIESTRTIEARGEGSGLGAVGGAVVGGILGNQVGAGHGRELATVVGAVGGVVAGNEIEKRVKTTRSYEVTVRLDDGSSQVVRQTESPSWRVGEHVRLVDGAIRAI